MKPSYLGKTVVNPVRDCNSLVDSYVKQLVIIKLSGFVVTEGGVERRGRGTIGKRQKKGAPSLFSVILLQLVMVSPGTHLVKNNESQSRTIESQFKNTSTRGL